MWINIKSRYPERIEGNKILGHNGEYAFECECQDGYWSNMGGETMTHWMPLPAPPTAEQEEERKFTSTNKQIIPVCPHYMELPIHDEDTDEVSKLGVCKCNGKPA